MKRENIEKLMKANKQESIVLWINENDKLGASCTLKSGYLTDYTGHRFNKKTEVWGYVNYDRKGNADITNWDKSVTRPFLRNSVRVDLVK